MDCPNHSGLYKHIGIYICTYIRTYIHKLPNKSIKLLYSCETSCILCIIIVSIFLFTCDSPF